MTSYQDKPYKKKQKYKTKSSYLKLRKLFRKLLVLETVLTFVQSLILTENKLQSSYPTIFFTAIS